MNEKEAREAVEDAISMALKGYPSLEKAFNAICRENAALESIAEFQQSSNTSRYFKLKKAKEIIKKLVDGIRVLNDPKVELTDCDGFLAEAEAFLKEVE